MGSIDIYNNIKALVYL